MNNWGAARRSRRGMGQKWRGKNHPQMRPMVVKSTVLLASLCHSAQVRENTHPRTWKRV